MDVDDQARRTGEAAEVEKLAARRECLHREARRLDEALERSAHGRIVVDDRYESGGVRW
jgi:hypothetical protein